MRRVLFGRVRTTVRPSVPFARVPPRTTSRPSSSSITGSSMTSTAPALTGSGRGSRLLTGSSLRGAGLALHAPDPQFAGVNAADEAASGELAPADRQRPAG